MSLVVICGACLMMAAMPAAAYVSGAPGLVSAPRVILRQGLCRTGLSRVAMAAVSAKKCGPMSKALKKPTGATTVSVEFNKVSSSTMSDLELNVLSMQLRKFKAASVWTADLEILAKFASEQKTAKGNFPGPVPLIFNGDGAQLEAAAAAGASALVLDVEELARAEAAAKLGLEVIWSVSSADAAGRIVNAGLGDAFLVHASVARDLVGALPKDSLKIAAVGAMQADNAEIAMGRELAAAGCKAVLVQEACVGDSEDLNYTDFCIKGLTSKASSEFKITGMTGHVNGHFGTGLFDKATGVTNWARVGGEGSGPKVSSTAAVVGKSAMRQWAAK